MLFYRKSAGFQKNWRTIQHIPHISMNMRGREVIASLWISWLLATLVITWTSCRTLGQSSALWVGFVNSHWSAGMSDCENGWWFEAWAILLYIVPHFYNACSSQLQKGTRDFLCCDFYFLETVTCFEFEHHETCTCAGWLLISCEHYVFSAKSGLKELWDSLCICTHN